MASIFSGTPQTATSYASSTSESPKWLQDAIFTQVQLASNLAAQPYTAYTGTLAAGLTPQQQQAYKDVTTNQGAWSPSFTAAEKGTKDLASAPGGLAAAQPYLTKAIESNGLTAAQPYLKQESSTLGGMNTQAGVQALSPYVNQALDISGVEAAQPYLQNAGQSSVSDINSYMNPYTQNVTDQIAKLGARNLTENLLPGVSDAFIKAGSFGGTRMGEFGSRALRDTQESVLGQQGQALQQGYTQALGASQADLARQAALATTAGNLTNAQQQAILSGGQALSSAQQQAQQQALAQAAQYGTMGQQAGSLTNAQQQALLTAGQQAGAMTQADLARQQSALQQLAQMSQQGQQMRTTDTAALEAAGSAQQQQAQKEADAAYQQWQNAQLYPRQTADWLSTQVRGMAPITPQTTTNAGSSTGQTYSASPLSQLASAGATGAGLYKLATGG